jgi:hypothetical protein
VIFNFISKKEKLVNESFGEPKNEAITLIFVMSHDISMRFITEISKQIIEILKQSSPGNLILKFPG